MSKLRLIWSAAVDGDFIRSESLFFFATSESSVLDRQCVAAESVV